MATIQEISPAPWRLALVPASYAGIRYHVEQQQRSGGRRVVVHEYPKRDFNYAEDMGRQPLRYQITGYLIGPNYHVQKRALVAALEKSQSATLIDPYLPEPKTCICERYSVTETRERGGYCTFEMTFVEVGTSGNTPFSNTSATADNQAASTSGAAAGNLNGASGQSGGGTVEIGEPQIGEP